MKTLKAFLLILSIAAADAVLLAVCVFLFLLGGVFDHFEQNVKDSSQVAEYAEQLLGQMSAAAEK